MRRCLSGALLALGGGLVGCAVEEGGPAAGPVIAPVELRLPVPAGGDAAGAVRWLHASDPAQDRWILAAGPGGIPVLDAAGKPLGGVTGIDADFIALAQGFDPGAGPGALVVVHDRGFAALRAYGIDAAGSALVERMARPLPLEAEATGLCLYRSPASARHYAFVATDAGDLQQWELYRDGDGIAGRLVRRLAIGDGAAACAVDDADSAVYVVDESVGIWRLSAEPETDTARRLLDLTAPRGGLGEEVKGLAIRHGAEGSVLLAVDEAAGIVAAYRLPEGRAAGQFRPDVSGEFETISVAAAAPGAAGGDLLAVAVESGSGPGFRLVPWTAVAGALQLPAQGTDPRQPPPATRRYALPTGETEPVDDFGDAADDPAIWIHPVDPARSLLIGAQKKRGLYVYDLAGRLQQLLPDGRLNNVDVRQRIDLGGRRLDLVAASNRSDGSIALYSVDPATGRLADIAAGPQPTGLADPYGLCLYHSARDGRAYVFINNTGDGAFRQWVLEAAGDRVAARLVREFVVGSQAEGCVADDETGALYVAEEDVGLWRYEAEPDGADRRRQIDRVGPGRLTADVEGVAIYRGDNGGGYIVASSQGNDEYAVYRRDGENDFVGLFSIGPNDALGIDGASETDGLEITSTPLGSAFPQGLLVVQDGRNLGPQARQNFKLVPWESVEAALGLR